MLGGEQAPPSQAGVDRLGHLASGTVASVVATS